MTMSTNFLRFTRWDLSLKFSTSLYPSLGSQAGGILGQQMVERVEFGRLEGFS